MGLQLYQVDHRSYLLDFRNLNANTDGHHPLLGVQDGLFVRSLFSIEFICSSEGFNEQGETENPDRNRSLSWEFDDGENSSSTDEPVSEVMEFFELAASLIRTLAPDSVSKINPKSTLTPSN